MNKTMASARTLVTNLLTRCNTDNLVAELELFQDDFQSLMQWLESLNFL